MRLTRRNALIGLGTVAAGAGVVGGSGAFTSVTAERTVSVETAGDSSAALQLIPAEDSSGNVTANASDYVDTSGDTISLDLTGTDNGASGLNQNAITTLENLVSVLNNGTQDITSLTLELTSDASINDNDTFQFTAEEKTQGGSDLSGIPNGEDILSQSNLNTDITAGSGSVEFGLIVDLQAGGDSNNSLPSNANTTYTLTITAETA